jgi:protein dithiol oxidoreductase (disulfide-forming)
VKSICLAALSALLLVACGGNEPPAQPVAAQPTAESAPPAAASVPPREAPAEQSAIASQPSQQQAASAPAVRSPSAADASRYQAGTHYQRLSPAQPISTDEGMVEVAEVFMYSCPACFAMEPHMTQWKDRKSDYVNLVRIPAAFNQLARVHAQAFYTAEALGKVDEMHTAFFTEIHVNNNLLDTEASLARFFGRFGVSESDFRSAWSSIGVRTRMQRADDLIRRYRVTGTPTLVVHGKYVTTGSMAGSYQAWFDIIDALAAAEHAAD